MRLPNLFRNIVISSSIALNCNCFLIRNCAIRNFNIYSSGSEVNPSVPELITNELSSLEIRVGKIIEIGKHPEADTLYVEKVDVGEADGPRTIVSGLVNYCSEEQLLNREVIVLCNLKPRAMRGIVSSGMLLCSSNEDHSKVEPLQPPSNSALGELIKFEGYKQEPVEAGNKAVKLYSKIADDFFVNDDGIATFRGTKFMTSAGPVTSSLKGKIS